MGNDLADITGVFRLVTDNVPSGVLIVDGEGVIRYANPSMEAICGTPADLLVGYSLDDDRIRPFLDFLNKHIDHAATLQESIRYEALASQCSIKSPCYLSGWVFPLMEEDLFRGMVITMRDVTRQTEAETALQTAHMNLEQRVEERTAILRKTIKKYRQEIIRRKWAESELQRNQERYLAVVEDQVELVCRFMPDTTLTFVNESLCRCFERDRASLLGKSFLPLLFDEDRDLARASLAGLSLEQPEARVQLRVVLADGEIRWQEWSARALYDEEGDCSEIQGVGRDVTDRVLAEQQADEARIEATRYRENLEAIFRSIPDAILTVDKDMRILNSNQAIHGLCCEAREMTTGRSLLDIANGQVRPCMRVLLKTLKTRKPVSEYRVECSTGVSPNQVMLLNSSPLLDHEGSFAGAVLLIRDITRLAELERRLDERSQFENIIGRSPQMQKVYTVLEQLVDLDTTVLITGESGTGKELIVDALHYFGARDTGPLIKVNCAALPETLLESELFGHVQGAFTGAVRDKIGRFQAAEGGTIFLDEIGDISPAVQLKLLRVLEQKEYERVGESRTYKADVRVIAATNKDLRSRIEDGRFRDDLFYRLQVMVIHLPPLRMRDGDLPLLVEHFVDHFRAQLGKDIVGVEQEVLDTFLHYAWPGNVRELKHTIERACILCPGGRITLEQLPIEILEAVQRDAAPEDAARHGETTERSRLLRVLEEARWNKTLAARSLGISRPTLYRRMRRLGIEET